MHLVWLYSIVAIATVQMTGKMTDQACQKFDKITQLQTHSGP